MSWVPSTTVASYNHRDQKSTLLHGKRPPFQKTSCARRATVHSAPPQALWPAAFSKGQSVMRLLSYNIQYGFGRDGIYDLARIAKVVKSADIAALQEVDRHWQRTGYDDQPALLAALLPDHFMAFGAGFDMDAATATDKSRRRQFGPMIVSRWPILWTRTHLLPLRRMITPINTQTCALEGVIAAPDGPLRVFSLHLAHVGVEERLAQIRHLQNLPFQGGPWSGTDDEPARNWTESQPEPASPAAAVWMGDFNMEPGSAEYLALTGQTPYHPGSRYADGLVDAVALGGNRLHTHEKVIAGARRLRQLDHCLVTPDLAPRVLRAWADASAEGSDHLPLWVELS
jgi:endonuclease/exonuclease/phosphatase family metal-dependent hydrolase